MKLISKKDRSSQPCHKMPYIHPRRRGNSIPAFLRITKNGQVAHPYMHRHIAEPRKEHDMPESKFNLPRQWLAALPDMSIRQTPEVAKRFNFHAGNVNKLFQTNKSKCQKNQNHPWRSNIRKLRNHFVAISRYYRDQPTNYQNGNHPAQTIGIHVI